MAQDTIDSNGQGNYVIDDGTGAQVRTRINTTYQAIATNNSGTTIPPANHHQWFANTNTGKLSYKDSSGQNNLANYFNLAKLTGGLSIDQPSDFYNDVVFKGTDSSGSFDITFDADNSTGRGALAFKDETKIIIGTGNDFAMAHQIDLNLFSALTDTRTVLTTRTNTAAQECFLLQTQDSSGQDSAYKAFLNAGQHLFFNGSKKCETTANGITVQGAVTTQDINMSNLNSLPNEVDSTQGSWSIQEGASDLFLINRISGKKYKFNLTEVT